MKLLLHVAATKEHVSRTYILNLKRSSSCQNHLPLWTGLRSRQDSVMLTAFLLSPAEAQNLEGLVIKTRDGAVFEEGSHNLFVGGTWGEVGPSLGLPEELLTPDVWLHSLHPLGLVELLALQEDEFLGDVLTQLSGPLSRGSDIGAADAEHPLSPSVLQNLALLVVCGLVLAHLNLGEEAEVRKEPLDDLLLAEEDDAAVLVESDGRDDGIHCQVLGAYTLSTPNTWGD